MMCLQSTGDPNSRALDVYHVETDTWTYTVVAENATVAMKAIWRLETSRGKLPKCVMAWRGK